MQKLWIYVGILGLSLTGCSAVSTGKPTVSAHVVDTHQAVATSVIAEATRNPNCKVNENISRKHIPKTPNNMSLPAFGQGVIGWATGPEGAKKRLDNVSQSDIPSFKDKGVTLEMVQEWQDFYENEVKRNPCNPTAPYRAELMKKIAQLWLK